MSSELQLALAHAQEVQAEAPAQQETVLLQHKRPVTHGLADKLQEAGFALPRGEEPHRRNAQNRAGKRHKRSEQEMGNRGGSSFPVHQDSNQTTGETIMPIHTSTNTPPVTGFDPASVAAAAAAAGPMLTDAMKTADHFLNHQTAKFKKTALQLAALDVAKFTVKGAVVVGVFTACCAIANAIANKGAPAAIV